MSLEDSFSTNGTYSKIGTLSLLSALNRLAFSFRIIALPLFALEIGQTEAFYGIMVAAAGYVQAIALFPAGTISDWKGRGQAILIGGSISGTCLIMLPFVSDPLDIIVLYAITGVGGGFIQTSLDSLIADYTRKGGERTKSYGYTIAFATLAAIIGPFMGGFILDPNAYPGIDNVMVRYAIIFTLMGSFRIATGIVGILTERWLKANHPIPEPVKKDEEPEKPELVHTAENDAKTALLFGVSQALMGISSGMVIPYLIPWIYAAFNPDPVVLGSIPAVANLTLASGTLFVGLSSERVGKIRMIGILYLLAPILTIGIVYSWTIESMFSALGIFAPAFFIMIVFYIVRQAVANMARPASNSLLMEEISIQRRGQSVAITRIMWTLLRQTGTLITAFILVYFGGIVTFGILVFPLALTIYPICVIPMYIAVRRNRKLREENSRL